MTGQRTKSTEWHCKTRLPHHLVKSNNYCIKTHHFQCETNLYSPVDLKKINPSNIAQITQVDFHTTKRIISLSCHSYFYHPELGYQLFILTLRLKFFKTLIATKKHLGSLQLELSQNWNKNATVEASILVHINTSKQTMIQQR